MKMRTITLVFIILTAPFMDINQFAPYVVRLSPALRIYRRYPPHFESWLIAVSVRVRLQLVLCALRAFRAWCSLHTHLPIHIECTERQASALPICIYQASFYVAQIPSPKAYVPEGLAHRRSTSPFARKSSGTCLVFLPTCVFSNCDS